MYVCIQAERGILRTTVLNLVRAGRTTRAFNRLNGELLLMREAAGGGGGEVVSGGPRFLLVTWPCVQKLLGWHQRHSSSLSGRKHSTQFVTLGHENWCTTEMPPLHLSCV